MPDHVLAGARPSPGMSTQPTFRFLEPHVVTWGQGHGFWLPADHWPFCSSIPALHTNQSVLPLPIKCDAVFHPTVSEHEIAHYHSRDATHSTSWEHSAGRARLSSLSALTALCGHQFKALLDKSNLSLLWGKSHVICFLN